jgi:hypothetical protein
MSRPVELLLVAALLAAGGCGGGASRAASTTSAPTTTERQIPSSNTTTTKPPPPTSTTTTMPEPGLPDSLPIPDASIITLGQGSTISSGVSITGVSLAEVRAWMLRELEAAGYTVVGDDGTSTVAFEGPGTSGTAVVSGGDGEIDLRLTLGAPAG